MYLTYRNSRHYFSFLILIYLVLVNPYHSAAQDWEKEILKKSAIYQSINHQEKIFVQTDRPVYVAGEEIWFSAFVLNASTQQLNQSEKVLYIDLISPEGTTCQKQLFKITQGRAWGNLPLKQNLETGNYYLVAYTNWMRNSGSNFYFSKKLFINREHKIETASNLSPVFPEIETLNEKVEPAIAQNFSVSFFPEGGNLIEGINCQVAFEVVDKDKHSVQVSGLVVDDLGQIIAAANTMWKGKGIFSMIPQPGRKYFIQLDEINEVQQKFILPDALPNGLALTIVNMPGQQQIKIMVTQKGDLPQNNSVFLLATQNGLPKKALQIDLSDKQSISVQIDKSDLNSGIVQFTLFDANKTPQVERLFFVKNQDRLSIKIKENRLPNIPRGKVDLTLEVTNQHGKPVAGDFALSVTDALRIPDEVYHSPNIFQYLTLFADLPENKNDDPSLFETSGEGNFKSELLMLTNGWCRYRWEEVLTDTIAIPQHLEEPGIYVKGTISTESKKNKIPDDAVVTMMTKGKKMELFSENIGKDGAFTFLLQDFEDTLRAIVQTKNRMNRKKDYAFDLFTNYQARSVDNFSKLIVNNDPFAYPSTIETENRKIEKSVLTKELIRAMIEDTFMVTTDYAIEEVMVESKSTKTEKEKITQKYGSPDYSVGKKRINELVEEKSWHYGLMTILSNAFTDLRIETTQITVDSVSITFRLINKKRHRFFIFVDGEMVGASNIKGNLSNTLSSYTIDDLISLNPELVTSIDLIFPKDDKEHSSLNSTAEFYEYEMEAYSTNNKDKMDRDLMNLAEHSEKNITPAAILSIYTKDGAGLYSSTHYKGIANLTLHGFTKVKEFYQPNYSSSNSDSILNDFRNTLAWLPNLYTDTTGKANFSFYTSDISNTFRVEANGVSNQGVAGALIYKMDNPMFNIEPVAEITNNEQPVVNDSFPISSHIIVMLPDSSGAAYASVKCQTNGWSTFTSPYGNFSIDKKNIADTTKLDISKPGYQTIIWPYAEIISEGVVLKPIKDLQSISSVEEILKNFYRSKYKNRNTNNYYLEGAYREQLFNEKELHQISDYYFIQKWQPLTEPNARIETHLYIGKNFRSNNINDKILFKAQNRFNDAVPVMDPFFSNQSFLNQAFAKNYLFALAGETYFQGRRMYHITFDQADDTPWALYEGELYIDTETFGLAWAKWRISDKGKKYVMPDEYLASGGDPETFNVTYEHNEITWSYNGKIWIPEFAISDITFSQKGFENRIIREMSWQSLSREITKFTPLLPENMNRRVKLVKKPKYAPAEWRISSLLPPCKEITNQIKFLNNVVFYN